MNPSLTVLDVGHGSCSILRDAGRTAVFDCARKASLLSYLVSEGIREVDVVIISHADEDHIGGLVGLLGSEEFVVRHIVINADSVKGTRIWEDLKFVLNAKFNDGKIKISGSMPGFFGDWPGVSTRFEVIAPSVGLVLTGSGGDFKGKKVSTNSMSVVVRIHCGEDPVALLGGDMDDITLSDILENGRQMIAPYLIFPHHGGKIGGADLAEFVKALLESVRPKFIAFSNGREKYDTPQPEIIDAIKDFGGIRVGCTQLSKRCSAEIATASQSWRSSKISVGAEKGLCCAGTIEIDLPMEAIAAPKTEGYRNFVDSLPAALCGKLPKQDQVVATVPVSFLKIKSTLH
ncbi:ComEC/Rec2 family competence protein [Burkholderia gladioli]|uniref:ComEC/Rec2 family competence protein n=1 Tax=Burkholderia gladioli TaxID=28095 RepID=UPI00163EA757|nr:MBL fold metallo-hydrolase [Burkholderia gladioli]